MKKTLCFLWSTLILQALADNPATADCFERGFKYGGGTRIGSPRYSVSSAEECHGICLVMADCLYFSFWAERERCLLLGDGAVEGRAPRAHWTSGPRECRVPSKGCFKDSTTYRSQNMFAVEPVCSAETCQKLCANQPGCSYFSFSVPIQRCVLKEGDIVRVTKDSSQVISGPAFCNDTTPKPTTTTPMTPTTTLTTPTTTPTPITPAPTTTLTTTTPMTPTTTLTPITPTLTTTLTTTTPTTNTTTPTPTTEPENTTSVAASCAEGWFRSGEGGEDTFCFRETDGSFVWSEANQACASLRSDAILAEPKTLQMFQAMYNYMEEKPGENLPIWIGLWDPEGNDNYRWRSNGEPYEFEDFGEAGNCVRVLEQYGTYWEVVGNCEWISSAFCQYQP